MTRTKEWPTYFDSITRSQIERAIERQGIGGARPGRLKTFHRSQHSGRYYQVIREGLVDDQGEPFAIARQDRRGRITFHFRGTCLFGEWAPVAVDQH